jgi:hypothetical protein
MADEKPGKKTCKAYPIGSFHLDIVEVRTEAGRLSLLVAMDRTCQLASAELHADANKRVAAEVLRTWRAALPYKIHTVLTDHGIQFTNRKRESSAFHHIVDRVFRSMALIIGCPKLTLPGPMGKWNG